MSIPLLIDSIAPEQLRQRICRETPKYSTTDPNYEIVYKLLDDTPGDYTRAIQELEILKTRLKLKDYQTGRTISLKSFAEIWADPESGLAEEVLASKDPNEAKWILAKKYKYKKV